MATRTTRDPLRALLLRALDWQDAHANVDAAVKGLPARLRGARAPGFEHSVWQLVEHLRLVQFDIYDFCVNAKYEERHFPDDYWPPSIAPTGPRAWSQSLAGYRRDLRAVQAMVADPRCDLFATIPHGTGQTYLREIVLIIDHTSYHVGQILAVRKALGAWP